MRQHSPRLRLANPDQTFARQDRESINLNNKFMKKKRHCCCRLRKIAGSQTFLIMKLSFILTFFAVLTASANVDLMSQKVSVNFQNAELREVFRSLTEQTGHGINYSFDKLRSDRTRVSVNLEDVDLSVALNEVLKGLPYTYTIKGQSVMIIPKEEASAQQPQERTVTGRVTAKNGTPLVGATVSLKGSTRGIFTDANGNYTLTVNTATPTIVVSYVGMVSHELTVNDTNQPVNVVMEESSTQIQEALITGIFNKPKISDPGASRHITQAELQQNRSRDLAQTISMLEPSFRIISTNEIGSDPNALPEIHLRGETTLLGYEDLAKYNGLSESDMDVKRTPEYLMLNSPIFILDGFEISLERFNDINIDEIADVTILKDANATSLYGSRGANGVIVLTSVRPQAGRTQVTYRGQLNLQIADLSTYDMLTAKEKLIFEKENGIWDKEDGAYMPLWEEYMARVERGQVFDWIKAPLRNGVGQYHSLNVSGGNENWRYSMNLSNRNTKGTMKGSDRNNFIGSINLYYQSERLRFSESLSVDVNTSKNSPYGSFSSYYSINPYYWPWDEYGEPLLNIFTIDTTDDDDRPFESPIYNAMKKNSEEEEYTAIRSATNVSYLLLPGLEVSANLGLDREIGTMIGIFVPSDTRFGGSKGGKYSRDDVKTDMWEIALGLNYYRTFNDKHTVSANAYTQVGEDIYTGAGWTAEGFRLDNMVFPSMSTSYPNPGHPNGYSEPSRRISFIGSVNYFYDNRLFVDATYRTDGSSSFGKFSRYNPYWSVGAGWLISNEKFIKNNLSFIDHFRVAYTYGVSGNLGFNPGDAMQLFGLNTQDSYLPGELILNLTQKDNPGLKAQETFQHNVGVELNLFKNRIRTSFNYYEKLTNNAVSTMYIPISHGFENMVSNIGTVRNYGYEYNLSFGIIRKPSDGFNLDMTFRFASNKNIMVKLSEGFKEYINQASTTLSNSTVEMLRYREGHSMSSVFALRSVGVDPMSGERWFLNKDGQIAREKSPDDLVYIGDRSPKLNGTIMLTARWKGFRLTAGFQVKTGGVVENTTESRAESLSYTSSIERHLLKDIWQKPGDKARYRGRNAAGGATFMNDQFVHVEHSISCGNLNLEYRLPSKFVNKLGLQFASVGMDYSDLFYFSTIKRERGTMYPFSRNPNFNLTISF